MTFDPMSVEVTCVTLPKDHCVQVPWEYINVCGYSDQFCKLPHTYTTTYIHILRTYYVQNEWSHSLLLNSVQARQLLNSVQARQLLNSVQARQKGKIDALWDTFWPLYNPLGMLGFLLTIHVEMNADKYFMNHTYFDHWIPPIWIPCQKNFPYESTKTQ